MRVPEVVPDQSIRVTLRRLADRRRKEMEDLNALNTQVRSLIAHGHALPKPRCTYPEMERALGIQIGPSFKRGEVLPGHEALAKPEVVKELTKLGEEKAKLTRTARGTLAELRKAMAQAEAEGLSGVDVEKATGMSRWYKGWLLKERVGGPRGTPGPGPMRVEVEGKDVILTPGKGGGNRKRKVTARIVPAIGSTTEEETR